MERPTANAPARLILRWHATMRQGDHLPGCAVQSVGYRQIKSELPSNGDSTTIESDRTARWAAVRRRPRRAGSPSGRGKLSNINGPCKLTSDLDPIRRAGQCSRSSPRTCSTRNVSLHGCGAAARGHQQDHACQHIDQLQGLAKQFASACVSVYEQTGHSTFAERLERFNTELREFALAVQGAAPH
jgi:hypothetical protein